MNNYHSIRAHQAGVGNVYFVSQAAAANYAYINDHLQTTYLDGTAAVQATIATALTATVANRNDYVIVCADTTQHAITSTLAMSKQTVHLIAPSGLNTEYGSGHRGVTITATGNVAVITTTARDVEIAGLFLKGYKANAAVIAMGTGGFSNIHHNFVGISAGAEATAGGIMCTDPAYSNNSDIHHNYVTNFNPTLPTGTNNTGVALIGLTSSSGTRNMIHDNIVIAGINTVWAYGILDVGTGIMVFDNLLHETITPGAGVEAGTFTLGVSTAADAFVARNLVTVATAASGVDGGTGNQSYIENYSGTGGGGTLLT